MSSSMTIRRLKERGGAGGKITPLKPQKTLTPISEKENRGSCRKSTGKENPRHPSATRIPAVCQKPVIRSIPMPRIDKPVGSGKDGDDRVRWSTSSIRTGKNSNPSDFVGFLSDLRKDRLSRVSASDRSVKALERSSVRGTNLVASNREKSINGFTVSEKSQQSKVCLDANAGTENGFRVLRDCKDGANFCVDSGRNNGKDRKDVRVVEKSCKEKACLASNAKPIENHSNDVRILDDCNGKVKFSSNSMTSGEKDVNNSYKDNCYSDSNLKVASGKTVNGAGVFSDSKGKAYLHLNSEAMDEEVTSGLDALDKCQDTASLDSSSKGGGEKASGGFKNVEHSEEKGANVGNSTRVVSKYPCKLHEKLAFLEGKVKRIASEIKQTKEMLDMNNPDASKMILSDIQDKISGIEKAMGHVINDSDNRLEKSKIVENDIHHCKNLGKGQIKQVGHLKSSVKGLNHEELEARLFPHHKLLRSRTLLHTSSGSIQNHLPHILEPSGDSSLEDGSLSPIDENPIALKFLASLKTNQSKVGTRGEHVDLEFCEIQEMEGTATSAAENISNKLVDGQHDMEIRLTSDEILDEFDDQENRSAMIIPEETEDACMDQLHEIGQKVSTGGWFVSEGESVLLAHDDGSCSFYDITNSEGKAEYKPPAGVSPNIWGDCWLIRAPGADGCSGRYVVAASAGNTLESGFCSWDLYSKDVRAFHVEGGRTMSSSRTVLGPLPHSGVYRRNALSSVLATENQQWWYKPCGPLIVSTASSQRVVRVYDIRDGEQVMTWEVQRPVLMMDHSSPLHWRNRGKVVIAETETISLWDVNSLNPQALLSVASSGRKISALHVNNTDAELGGGVRRRVSSSEAEGNDGVFCTMETINVLDFRLPSGVGLKISKLGVNVQSIFSCGDSIFLGCTNSRSASKELPRSQVQQFSVRKGRLVSTYAFPGLNAHSSAITQVWGNSSFVMGVSALGLFVFDALKEDVMQSCNIDYENAPKVRDIIGPDDLYYPSFDYLSSRVLVISKDRPALWRHLL